MAGWRVRLSFGDLGKREAFRPLPRVLALLFLVVTGPAAAATLTGKADIVDADTIKVGGIPVRFYGIDAPESRQTCERDGKPYACGKQATMALADLIAGRRSLERMLSVARLAFARPMVAN
jgi:endonuclease YncB( thermonuclease family)